MGRTDTQAKLGGQRLELSEVEHHLREASAFRAVSAFVPKAGPFAGRLTAVLGAPHASTGSSDLPPPEPQLDRCSPSAAADMAASLGEALPSFMVPSVWLRISHYPMTSSGKLSRSLVLGMVEAMAGQSDVVAETSPPDPGSGEEVFLQQVCAAVLGLEPATVDFGQSFIQLGGDSIRAMQVVARYREAGRKGMTTKLLLTSSRLSQVATEIRGLHDVAVNGTATDGEPKGGTERRGSGGQQAAGPGVVESSASWRQIPGIGKALLALPTVRRMEDVEDVFPLSPMQESLVLSLARLGGRLYMDEFLWELRAADGSNIDPDRLEQAWEAVVARHQALRTVFVDVDADEEETTEATMPLHQAVLKRGPASFSGVRAASDDEARRVARESPRMLDKLKMSHGELIHTGLSTHSMLMVYNGASDEERGRGRVWLRFEVSHLVEDAMSILPLLRDLSLAYRHGGRGPDFGSRMAPMTASAEFVRQTRDRHRREASLAYWSSYLKGAEACRFPSLIDSDSSSVSESGGRRRRGEQRDVRVKFGENTSGLRQAVARLGITLPTFFQTVWALVLHVYTGKTEIVLGNIDSGRGVPVRGIQEAFGLFMGMLVCRVDLLRRRDDGDEEELHDDHHGDDGEDEDERDHARGRTLLNIMKRIQRDTIEGSSKQSCSLAEMQHAAGLVRDGSSGAPLFNSGISCRPLVTEADQEDFALLFTQLENRELSEVSSVRAKDMTYRRY